MQTVLQLDEIAQRLSRIGMPPKALARLAGVNFATYYRGRQRPGSMVTRNLAALSAALIAEELALRDHLLALHPLDTAPLRLPEAAE